MNLLLKEGMVMYINDMEAMRVNMNSVGNVKHANATKAFFSHRFIPSSLSHQFFRQGKNVIALAIHSHVTSSSPFFFSMELLRIRADDYFYHPAYPTVDASVNQTAAYTIANVYSPIHSLWSGEARSFISYAYPDGSHHYINAVAVSRSESNPPQSIELDGVWKYQDEFGTEREVVFLLLQETDLDWSGRSQLVFSLPSARTSYHAYRLRFNRMI